MILEHQKPGREFLYEQNLFRQRIRPQLKVHGERLAALAVLHQPRRAIAAQEFGPTVENSLTLWNLHWVKELDDEGFIDDVVAKLNDPRFG